MVLVSAAQQRESAVRIAISPLFVAFSPVSATRRFSLWNPVGSHWLSILYTIMYITVSQYPTHPLGSHMSVFYIQKVILEQVKSLPSGTGSFMDCASWPVAELLEEMSI